MPSLQHGIIYSIFAYMRFVQQTFRNIEKKKIVRLQMVSWIRNHLDILYYSYNIVPDNIIRITLLDKHINIMGLI